MKYSWTACLLGLCVLSVGSAQEQPGFSLHGTVVDANDQPVAAQVRVFQRVVRDGFIYLYAACVTKTTNGRFDCSGLPDGTFIEQVISTPTGVEVKSRQQQAVAKDLPAGAFYPGVTDIESADVISLGEGQNRWVDMRLPEAQGFRLSGTLAEPVPGALIKLHAGSGTSIIDTEIPVHYDGVTGLFVIDNVPNGRYTLVVDWISAGTEHASVLPVSVAGADVTGLRPFAAASVVLKGRVINKTEDGTAPLQLRLMRVDGTLADLVVSTDSFGMFTFYSVEPGDYILDAASGSLDVDDVSVDGRNAGGRRIAIPAGRESVGVDVHLGAALGTISGMVIDSNGASEEADVVAYAKDTGQIYATRTDRSGRFALRSRSGDYNVYAWLVSEATAYRSPQVLTRFADQSERVSTSDDNQSLNITVRPIEIP